MVALQLLLGFAPWIAFLLLSAGHTLFWLDVGLIAAAVLTVVLGVAGVHRGAILWSGAAFFALALVAVLGFRNLWIISHMGLLASVWLFATAALSLLVRKPFTEAYARQHAPREIWSSPEFRGSCYFTTGVWAGIFLFNALLNAAKIFRNDIGPALQIAEYAALIAGVAFTSLYAARARKHRPG